MKNKPLITPSLAIACVAWLVIQACTPQTESRGPWVQLFDGQTLDGWHTLGGDADYSVRDGAIVGSTVYDPKSVSTFLMSDSVYDNFILEIETKLDEDMNSGILIRSNSDANFQNNRVYGYQVEIDPSDRKWSGGIYESAKRGWLYTLDGNPEAQKAFKKGDWNKYRIEFIGDTLRTWVNGIPTAHLVDDKGHKGYIALQVHGIKKGEREGAEVMWRNISILTQDLDKYAMKSALTPLNTDNTLTMQEEKKGWKLLWDGKTTKGWRGAKLDSFPPNGWIINKGALEVQASGGAESAGAGDIVTVDQFSDFELSVDFRVNDEQTANSGIKYYADTEIGKGTGSSIGLEYQILGTEHPGNVRVTHRMASLYDLIEANPKPVSPTGEWNTVRIVSKDQHVEHWLNDVKVLEYERGSAAFRELVAKSKYASIPHFGELERGRILLQEHGSYIAFKNIKINEL